jgi:hypothetical protein
LECDAGFDSGAPVNRHLPRYSLETAGLARCYFIEI